MILIGAIFCIYELICTHINESLAANVDFLIILNFTFDANITVLLNKFFSIHEILMFKTFPCNANNVNYTCVLSSDL